MTKNKNDGIDIIKSNQLIRGKDNLEFAERRFCNLVLSKLTLEKPYVQITTNELSDILGYKVKDWSNIKRLVEFSGRKMFTYRDEMTDTDIMSVIFRRVEHKQGIYTIYLEDTLIPHILEYKDNKTGKFTMFNSMILQQFKFKHSQRIYELLKSWLKVRDRKYELEQLKYQLNMQEMENKFFFRDILDKAISEINKVSDIYIQYEKDKSTKIINYLNFTITNNPNYKHEKVKSLSSNTDTQDNMIIQTFAVYNKKPTFEQIQQLNNILEKDFNNCTEDMIKDINKFFANDKVNHKHISTYIKFEKKYEVKKDSEKELKVPEHLLNETPVAEYVRCEDRGVDKKLEDIF